MSWGNLQKSLIILGLLAFVALSNFGLGHAAGMQTNNNGDMEGCIFTGKTMLCQMSVMEHISLWQTMFTAAPQKASTLLALLALLIAVIFVVAQHKPQLADRKQDTIHRLYLFRHPDISLFDPLRRAFSQGIIHPKIYEFANI